MIMSTQKTEETVKKWRRRKNVPFLIMTPSQLSSTTHHEVFISSFNKENKSLLQLVVYINCIFIFKLFF